MLARDGETAEGIHTLILKLKCTILYLTEKKLNSGSHSVNLILPVKLPQNSDFSNHQFLNFRITGVKKVVSPKSSTDVNPVFFAPIIVSPELEKSGFHWTLNAGRSYKRQGHAPLKHFVGFLCNGGKPE